MRGWEAPVFTERTSVGLDVHARSIVACGLDTVTGQVVRQRLVPSAEAVLVCLRELPTPVAVAYEAALRQLGNPSRRRPPRLSQTSTVYNEHTAWLPCQQDPRAAA